MQEENKTQQPQAESTQQPVDDLEKRLESLDAVENTEQTSTPQEQPSPEPQNNLPDISELEVPTETSEPKAEAKPQDSYELPDTPEAKKFAEDFKQYLGFDVNELRTGIKELEQYRQTLAQERVQQQQEKQMSSLQEEWGLDKSSFEGRMKQVIERFQKYSPEMQARLDSVEGAKLIWAKLEQEQSQNNVPNFVKSSGFTSGGKKYLFTASEIKSMSKEQYAKNADRILKAYQQGLVDNNQ